MFCGKGDLDVYMSPELCISSIQSVYEKQQLFIKASDSSSCYVGLFKYNLALFVFVLLWNYCFKEDLIEL